MASLAGSREFFEKALSDAEALGDRIETRLIALRLCELIEYEDFDETRRRAQWDVTTTTPTSWAD